jgi:hypothetical protein
MQDPQHTDGDAHAATVDGDAELSADDHNDDADDADELTDDDPLRSEVEQ